jgi:hypothetical protein
MKTLMVMVFNVYHIPKSVSVCLLYKPFLILK